MDQTLADPVSEDARVAAIFAALELARSWLPPLREVPHDRPALAPVGR